ncbi:MAG: hypothetical protein R3344_00060 [Acidobacteriota bacterium]|nr:hypothetical protein [Acidobacteriota bacterium]
MRRAAIAVSVIIAVGGFVLAEESGVDLRRWIGKDRAVLAEGWGEPRDLKKKKNGGEVVVYEVFAGSHIVESWTPCGSDVNLGLRDDVLKITFWLDSDGRVKKVRPKVLKFEPDSPEDDPNAEPPEFWVDPWPK